MKRAELDHVIGAASEVADDEEIVVIGSLAILGQLPDAHETLLRSHAVDLYPRRHPERAEQIDGALGDGSQFQATFGYHARGARPERAKAPAGWEDRLVPVRVSRGPQDERVVTGWCMEPHDVVLAKCAAGRERDWEFARNAICHGVVDTSELLRRAADLPLPDAHRERVIAVLGGLIASLEPQ